MLKKIIAKLFASFVVRQIESTYSKAAKIQKQTLIKLIKKASKTQFGLEHNFKNINDFKSFKSLVPVRDYEGIKTISIKLKTEKRISFGQENQDILLKHQELLAGRNSFQFQMNQCPIT